jgi:hypothetical protein
MYQTGTGFDELPVAFQKSNGCEELSKIVDVAKGKRNGGSGVQKSVEEVKETVEGFQRCSTIRDLLRLLATVPSDVVTPIVALEVLKKLIQLENNTQFRNDGYSDKLYAHQPENFTRSAVAGTLCDKICASPDANLLLAALQTFHKDYCPNPDINTEHVVKLSNELMFRAINCDLTFQQAAELALHFTQIQDEWAKSFAEKLWLCIVDKAHEVNSGAMLVLLFKGSLVQWMMKPWTTDI